MQGSRMVYRGRISRRRLLHLAAASVTGVTALAMLAACGSQPQPSPQAPAQSASAPSSSKGEASSQSTPTVAQQAASSAPEQATISMWFHDQLYVRFWTSRAEEFEQQHTSTKFTWDIQQVPQLADKYMGTITAGQGAPDIIGVENGWMPRLLKEDRVSQAMVDLKPYMQRDGIDEKKYRRLELYSWKGGIYGLESGLSHAVYYYRHDIFEKVGIQPPFETYDDFVAAGKTLKEAGHFIMPVDTSNGMANWQVHALQAGGQFFDADGKPVINSPGNAKCLTLMKRLLDEGIGKPFSEGFWGPTLIAAYKDDSVAGVAMPDWYSDYVLKENLAMEQSGKWRITYLPRYEKDGARTSASGGTGHGISKQSKNQDLVWELLKYGYLTKENQVKRYLEIHYFPNMVDAWEDPRITSVTDEFFGGQNVGKIFAELAPEVPVFYQSPWRPEASQQLSSEAWVPVLTGQKTVEQGLKDAQASLEKIISSAM